MLRRGEVAEGHGMVSGTRGLADRDRMVAEGSGIGPDGEKTGDHGVARFFIRGLGEACAQTGWKVHA